MVANLNFNPMINSNAAGTFGVHWDGLIAGTAYPDPATRFGLASGWLSDLETIPMWGGVAVSEQVPLPQGAPPMTPDPALQGAIRRATNLGPAGTALSLTGISVFNQAYGMINSPQQPVPAAPSYGQVMFHRMGQGARICVATAGSFPGGQVINTPVSWDFLNHMLVPFEAAYPANVITAATWAATNGGEVTFTTTTAHTVEVGGVFNITGMTPAGYNGQYVAKAGTTGSTLIGTKLTNPGAATVMGTLVAGGGAFPCIVLAVRPTNCMVPTYNSATGQLSWNRNGSAAVIQI